MFFGSIKNALIQEKSNHMIFFSSNHSLLYLILLEIRIFFTKSNNGPSRCGAKKNLCMLVIVSK